MKVDLLTFLATYEADQFGLLLVMVILRAEEFICAHDSIYVVFDSRKLKTTLHWLRIGRASE